MPELVIWVSGGVVRSVRGDEPGLSVEVIDADEIDMLATEREKHPEAFVDYLWRRRHLLKGLAQPVVDTDPDTLRIHEARYPHVLY